MNKNELRNLFGSMEVNIKESSNSLEKLNQLCTEFTTLCADFNDNLRDIENSIIELRFENGKGYIAVRSI